MDTDTVRARVRRMLETGALPCDEPARSRPVAGSAPTVRPAASRSPVTDIEFEVDLASGTTLRLQRLCHEVWREECDTLQPR